MVRCGNICCCCSAKTGCMLAGVLALFSSMYYFAFAILGLLDIYVTHILLDIWALVVGLLCLFAGIIILIAYQGRKERFVMAFVCIYGTCACFRGVYLANALVVWIKWSQRGWRRTIDADYADAPDVERIEQRNYEPACIANTVFLAFCLLLDIWAVLAAIVWASQLGRIRRKHEAAAAAAAFEEKRRRSSLVVPRGKADTNKLPPDVGASALVKPVSNAGHAAADAGAAADVHGGAGGTSIRRHHEHQQQQVQHVHHVQHATTTPAGNNSTATPVRTYQSVGTDVMGRTPKQATKREVKHTATQMTPKPRKDDNNLTSIEMRQPLIGSEQTTTTTEEYVNAGDGINNVDGTTTKRVVTTTVVREQQVIVVPADIANKNGLAIEDVQA